MDEPAEPRPLSSAKPSKTPSWVMLGFVLGALFVWSLEHSPENRPPPPAVEPEKPATVVVAPLLPPRMSDVEAVFAMWGGSAIWENDVTEVALWTPETKRYSDFFEVIRSGENLYFRSIPHLTRRILDHGVQENSPLQLTETEAHRQEWLRDVKDVSWRAFTAPASEVTTPATPPMVRPGRTGTPPESGQPYRFVIPPPPITPPPPASQPPPTGSGDGKP